MHYMVICESVPILAKVAKSDYESPALTVELQALQQLTAYYRFQWLFCACWARSQTGLLLTADAPAQGVHSGKSFESSCDPSTSVPHGDPRPSSPTDPRKCHLVY